MYFDNITAVILLSRIVDVNNVIDYNKSSISPLYYITVDLRIVQYIHKYFIIWLNELINIHKTITTMNQKVYKNKI